MLHRSAVKEEVQVAVPAVCLAEGGHYFMVVARRLTLLGRDHRQQDSDPEGGMPMPKGERRRFELRVITGVQATLLDGNIDRSIVIQEGEVPMLKIERSCETPL